MASSTLASITTLLSLAAAQQIGTPESHPPLRTQKCTTDGGCVDQNTVVVLDALSHPLNKISTGESCMNSTGGIKQSVCTTAEECASLCAYDGASYTENGVTTNDDSLTLKEWLSKDGELVNVSPRLYLLAEGGHEYADLQLVNQELSFDVDMSNLPCGMNAALYLGEMEMDGGRGYLNPAGATYGTGYCDAQCYTPTWLNGVLNTEGRGACCNELDIWEANARATALVPHPCVFPGFYGCEGDECGPEGVCDKPGCGFNPYANLARNFYGLSDDEKDFAVDTTRPFTVTTQFISCDGTPDGRLHEIRRQYAQDGQTMRNARIWLDDQPFSAISDEYCAAQDASSFLDSGGLTAMGEAVARGMVLTWALWVDDTSFMTWLDAECNGPCNATEGDPAIIQAQNPDADVTFSAIKWGDIGSTT